MIDALGGRVERLHRDRIGALALPDDLAPGVMRPLRRAERHALMEGSSGALPDLVLSDGAGGEDPAP